RAMSERSERPGPSLSPHQTNLLTRLRPGAQRIFDVAISARLFFGRPLGGAVRNRQDRVRRYSGFNERAGVELALSNEHLVRVLRQYGGEIPKRKPEAFVADESLVGECPRLPAARIWEEHRIGFPPKLRKERCTGGDAQPLQGRPADAALL